MNSAWSIRLKYPPTPEYAAQLAELMVESARRTSEADLDFSADSLKQVDRIVRRMRREDAEAGQVATTLFGYGCYVGEVFVRHAGGQWRLTEETHLSRLTRSPMVVELDEHRFCDPIFTVFGRFAHARENDLPYFFKVHARLLREEPGEPEGFWRRLVRRR